VFTEMSSLLCRSNGHWRGRSNGHWRGRSFAASVPSDDASKVPKGRKRVSKDERKAMVLSFVNEYRASNAGKFPTISEAVKQVGGSYYVIRKILQELEYQSTTSSMNARNDMKLGKVVVKVNDTSKQVEDISGTRVRIDTVTNKDVKTVAGYDVDIDDSTLKNVVTDKGPRSSTSSVKAMSEEVVKHKPSDECSMSERRKHISEGKAEGDMHQCPEKPEHGVKERSHLDDVLDIDGPKTKSEQHQQSSESDKFARALSEKQDDDQELSKKSSVWGNLKTLADDIMKMWNKW